MICPSIARYALALPAIAQGLAKPYSPNHTQGMTTQQHISRQLSLLEMLEQGDFAGLAQRIHNPKVEAQLVISPQDLEEYLAPLIAPLSPANWALLAATVAFHDLGKIDLEWASEASLDLRGVDWIAHDFDSETLLQHNPQLYQPLGLSPQLVQQLWLLCRLHSLPGQCTFGEGNLSGYGPLMEQARLEGVPHLLNLASIHGMLDVMSALNEAMVRPILSAHQQLRQSLLQAWEEEIDLLELARREAALICPLPPGDWTPLAAQRLSRLLGTPPVLEDLEPRGFVAACDGPGTWYGTYVTSALGGGLVRAGVEPQVVARRLVEVLSRCAQLYGGERQDWAIGALELARALPQRTQEVLEGPLVFRVGASGVAVSLSP